jgi:hypothetical protein
MANPTLAQRNAPTAPKLLDRVHETMRMSRYSRRTQAAYVCHARPDLNYCHHQEALKPLIRALSVLVQEMPTAFHPRAQRSVCRRRDAHQQSRSFALRDPQMPSAFPPRPQRTLSVAVCDGHRKIARICACIKITVSLTIEPNRYLLTTRSDGKSGPSA